MLLAWFPTQQQSHVRPRGFYANINILHARAVPETKTLEGVFLSTAAYNTIYIHYSTIGTRSVYANQLNNTLGKDKY